MKRARLVAVSFLITLACNGDKLPTTPATTSVPPPAIVSLSLAPLVQTIAPGQTARLTVTAHYSDGSTTDVTSQAIWSSSQAKVATVAAGAVTGVGLGLTEIRVTVPGGGVNSTKSTSITIVIEPDGTFILTGTVTEAGGLAVAGATVEVIGGAPNQVFTNSLGFYQLFGVGGTSIVRFGKTDYFDERRTVTMSADQTLNVEITPRSAPAAVAGTYRVTFIASPSCTILPAELKTRTYTATIEQDAARLMVTLSGASFVSKQNTFSGKVVGDTVRFEMGGSGFDYGFYYYGTLLQEVLPSGQILGLFGNMTAPATPQSISGTYVGGFTLKIGNTHTSCAAKDNQVVFTRQ